MRIANRHQFTGHALHMRRSGPSCEEWVTAEVPVRNEGLLIPMAVIEPP